MFAAEAVRHGDPGLVQPVVGTQDGLEGREARIGGSIMSRMSRSRDLDGSSLPLVLRIDDAYDRLHHRLHTIIMAAAVSTKHEVIVGLRTHVSTLEGRAQGRHYGAGEGDEMVVD